MKNKTKKMLENQKQMILNEKPFAGSREMRVPSALLLVRISLAGNFFLIHTD